MPPTTSHTDKIPHEPSCNRTDAFMIPPGHDAASGAGERCGGASGTQSPRPAQKWGTGSRLIGCACAHDTHSPWAGSGQACSYRAESWHRGETALPTAAGAVAVIMGVSRRLSLATRKQPTVGLGQGNEAWSLKIAVQEAVSSPLDDACPTRHPRGRWHLHAHMLVDAWRTT